MRCVSERRHGYRFEKQSLLWNKPRLRTPAQFERWSHIVAIAHNHLVLAHELVEAQVRPWENKQHPSTPQYVRGGMTQNLFQADRLASFFIGYDSLLRNFFRSSATRC
jgi:hypothetical protein